MNERPHIATLLAMALVLASIVNLSIIYVMTSRARTVTRASAGETIVHAMPRTAARPSTPAKSALRKNDPVSIRKELDRCLNDRSCDLDKNLRLAAASNEPAVARKLIAAGARVNATDKDHGTALHSAVTRGGTGVVEVLLQAGADVNARDEYGLTPLHSAAAWGHLELTHVLLAAGADANAADVRKLTPLHLVAARRVPPLSVYADVAKELIDAGARLNVRSSDGSTPLHLARLAALRLSLEGNVKATGDANEVVALLREKGGHE